MDENIYEELPTYWLTAELRTETEQNAQETDRKQKVPVVKPTRVVGGDGWGCFLSPRIMKQRAVSFSKSVILPHQSELSVRL